MASALFRYIVTMGRSSIVSSTFGSFVLLILFALGGSVLSRGGSRMMRTTKKFGSGNGHWVSSEDFVIQDKMVYWDRYCMFLRDTMKGVGLGLGPWGRWLIADGYWVESERLADLGIRSEELTVKT
ncbi:hypothetical protein ACET3Z_006918 [Daucus carota]